MKVKKLLASCLAAVSLVSLAACGMEPTSPVELPEVESSNPTSQKQQIAETKAEQADDGRTILRLGVTNPLTPELQERVDSFNAENTEYVIEQVDYSMQEGEGVDSGFLKLRTDIIGGTAPDMLQLENMPVEVLTGKGLLEELSSYIDNDPDLGPDGLVAGARRALSDEDGLHRIAPFFFVSGLYGAASAIGDRDSWTFDELCDFLGENSSVTTPFINMSINMLVGQTVEQFISEDGSCNFESPEFISLLEVMKKYGGGDKVYVDNAGSAIVSGKHLLSITYISGVDDYAALSAEMGGDLKLIGLPSQSGSGNIADFPHSFGMLSSSPSKEGCWQFLRTLFDAEFQGGGLSVDGLDAIIGDSSKIPVLRSAFEADLASSPASQSVKDEFVAIVDGMQYTGTGDYKIVEIIIELLPKLYDGTMSAEELAKEVQTKASIYLSENI